MMIACPFCGGDGMAPVAEQMRLARPLNRGQWRGLASSNFTITDTADGGLGPCIDCDGWGSIHIGLDGSDRHARIDIDDMICRAFDWAGSTANDQDAAARMFAADAAAEAEHAARTDERRADAKIAARRAAERALTAERARTRVSTPATPPAPSWPDVERRLASWPLPDINERRAPMKPAARQRIRDGRARARAAMAGAAMAERTPDEHDDDVRDYMTDRQHRRLLMTQAEARDELARRRLLRDGGVPFLLWTEAPTFADAVIYCAAYNGNEPEPGGTP